jgi:hypothetical protein
MDYVANPEKTEADAISDDLSQVLAYAQDEKKTEKLLYVSGLNCIPKIACEQFMNVKRQFAKTDGILATHAYMSFAPGEVTPAQAHAIGLEVAEKLWGERYQVIVTTHLNTNCLHNHFVVNSVSFRDGKRLRENSWFINRRVIDEICRAHTLSIVENPERNHDAKYLKRRESEGKPTRYQMAREIIDEAVNRSTSLKEFAYELRRMGCTYKLNDTLKYWTVTLTGYERPIRLYRLGEDYTNDRIRERLKENQRHLPQRTSRTIQNKHVMKAPKPKQKVGGIKGLYLFYCYQLGVLPKRKPSHARLHYLLKEDLLKLDEITNEVRFMGRNHIETEEQLTAYTVKVKAEIGKLTETRKHLRAEARLAGNADRAADLRRQASALTKRISFLKNELVLGESVAVRSGIITEHMERVFSDEEKEKRKEKKDVQRW